MMMKTTLSKNSMKSSKTPRMTQMMADSGLRISLQHQQQAYTKYRTTNHTDDNMYGDMNVTCVIGVGWMRSRYPESLELQPKALLGVHGVMGK
jgi:hypothetical protein